MPPIFTSSKIRARVNNTVEELIIINLNIKSGRRFSAIIKKARGNKARLAVFAVWAALSLLSITIIICAGHAVNALADGFFNNADAVNAIASTEGSTSAVNWYCKNNDTHARPELPSELKSLTRNNGVWLGGEGCGKVIYLTFDAGYENGNVVKILDILKTKNVPGAFFVLDNLIRRNSELVKRMSSEGHLVCNHTSHHKDMTKLTADEFKAELTTLEDTARSVAGVELAKFYRPPCGTFSERDLRLASELGYKTVMWSYAYADWDNKTQMIPAKALDKLLGHTHEGMVLLLHPTSSTNAEILSEFIDRMTADGWRFGKLDELTVG